MRMTRQIRNLMMPLREKGLMEGVMIHSLRALRKNSDLLLAIMDVFIKEPSLDWQVSIVYILVNILGNSMYVVHSDNGFVLLKNVLYLLHLYTTFCDISL